MLTGVEREGEAEGPHALPFEHLRAGQSVAPHNTVLSLNHPSALLRFQSLLAVSAPILPVEVCVRCGPRERLNHGWPRLLGLPPPRKNGMTVVPNDVIAGSYSVRLVAFSVCISVMASYAALDLAGRVTSARGRARVMWLCGGVTAMGVGIWSMHYVGMLAFRLPIPV